MKKFNFSCRFFVFALALLGAFTCSGYPYEAELDQKDNQDLVCVWDAHGNDPIAHKNRLEIVAAAKARGAKLIIEDSDTVQRSRWLAQYKEADLSKLPEKSVGDDFYLFLKGIKTGKEYLSLDLGLMPLWGMTKLCEKLKIDAVSPEFRLVSQHLRETILDSTISELEDYIALTNSVCKEIAAYDDGVEFNRIYKDGLEAFEKESLQPLNNFITRLKEFSQKINGHDNGVVRKLLEYVSVEIDKGIIEFIWKHARAESESLGFSSDYAQEYVENSHRGQTKEEQLVEFLLNYNVYLLDFKILHELANSDNKTVFIYAGGFHMRNISKYLDQLGFVKKASTRDLQKFECVYAPINLSTFFRDIYGNKFLQMMKQSMSEITNTIEETLPPHEERGEWLAMIKRERDTWSSMEIEENEQENVLLADVKQDAAMLSKSQENKDNDWNNLFLDSFSSFFLPFGLANLVSDAINANWAVI